MLRDDVPTTELVRDRTSKLGLGHCHYEATATALERWQATGKDADTELPIIDLVYSTKESSTAAIDAV